MFERCASADVPTRADVGGDGFWPRVGQALRAVGWRPAEKPTLTRHGGCVQFPVEPVTGGTVEAVGA